MIDGLWGGSEANDPPRKWSLALFNNDWTSSIFVSQDQVALESVCFDFLKTEFTADNPYGCYPQISGVDDYLVQASDSSYWPANVRYDPEKDGTTISSLGVHEHWNNAIEKQYSRNLGTGEGIELVFIAKPATGVAKISIADNPTFVLHSNYPNPFNAATIIHYQLLTTGDVRLKIINMLGQKIKTLIHEQQPSGYYSIAWDGNDDYGITAASGLYLCCLTVGTQSSVQKMLYVK
jgi:hypothetical protein